MYTLYKVVPLGVNTINIPYYTFTEYRQESEMGTKYYKTSEHNKLCVGNTVCILKLW
jgi:hypothetical protein